MSKGPCTQGALKFCSTFYIRMTGPPRNIGPLGKQGSLLEVEVIEDFFFSVRNHDSVSKTDDLGVDSHGFGMFLGP